MENTLWNRTTDISKNSKTPVILLACSAAALLASCSAGPADSVPAETTGSPEPSASPAVPSPSAESAPLLAPLSPESKMYPPEELVLSEKGTGTGNYVIEGGLKEGQSLTVAVAAACNPGEKVALRTEPALGGISNLSCESLPFVMYGHVSESAVPELEVAVETSAGGTFWVQARASYDATVIETKSGTGE